MKRSERKGSPFFVQSNRSVGENWCRDSGAFEAAKRACKDKSFAKQPLVEEFEHTSLFGARKGRFYYLLTPPEAFEIISGETDGSGWELLWEVHWPSGWGEEWSAEMENALRETYDGWPKSMR